MLWSATGDLNQQDGEMLRVSVINNSSSGSSTGEQERRLEAFLPHPVWILPLPAF